MTDIIQRKSLGILGPFTITAKDDQGRPIVLTMDNPENIRPREDNSNLQSSLLEHFQRTALLLSGAASAAASFGEEFTPTVILAYYK